MLYHCNIFNAISSFTSIPFSAISFNACFLTVYPIGFIKSVISDFKEKDENQSIISDWLFEERSKVSFNLPYCPKNEYEKIY